MNVFGGLLESACLSVYLCVCLCVCPSVYKILVSVKALAGLLTHYQMTNFGFFQIERLADDNFEFDENGR